MLRGMTHVDDFGIVGTVDNHCGRFEVELEPH